MARVPILINPPASRLGSENAILWGRGRSRYHVREFPGPLSIKAVVRGTAEWQVGKSRFEIDASSYLVLNHGQPYSITIDSAEPVETFCIFFARGFVEDAWRSLTSPAAGLLDDPSLMPAIGFYDRLRPRDRAVSAVLQRLHQCIVLGEFDETEASFYEIALGLAGLKDELAREVARIPASRASTRHELHKRVHRGKQAIDELFSTPLALADIARNAHLSQFHFHRAFAAAFGETPHAYRTRRRLETAARLLAESDRSVLDICLEAGFESPASFSTLFRKRYASGPRAFREFARSNKSSGVFFSRMLP